jgi:hypothetical protein
MTVLWGRGVLALAIFRPRSETPNDRKTTAGAAKCLEFGSRRWGIGLALRRGAWRDRCQTTPNQTVIASDNSRRQP